MKTKQFLVAIAVIAVVATLTLIRVGFDRAAPEAFRNEVRGGGSSDDLADPDGVGGVEDPASRSAKRVEVDTEAPASDPSDPPQLWVHVVEANGSPVEGAQVLGFNSSHEVRIAASAKTDALGVTALESPRDWFNTGIVATHGERMSIPRNLRRLYGEVTLQVQSTRPLRCTVVDGTTGAPLLAAGVEMHQVEGSTLREATTDSDGWVELGSWPVGLHARVWVGLDGYVPTERAFSIPETPGSDLLDTRIELYPARPLSGRVVDAETGAPIPEARVTTDSNGRTKGPSCDVDGRFELAQHVLRDARTVTLEVSAPGYTRIKSEIDAEDWKEEIRVRLPRLAVLTVSVVLPDGTPARSSMLTHSDLDQGHPVEVPEGLDEWLDEGWTLGFARSHLQPVENPGGVRTFEIFRVPFSDSLRLAAVDGEYGRAHATAPPAGPPGSRSSFEIRLRDPSDEERTGQIRGVLSLNGVGTRGFVHWINGKEFGSSETDELGAFELTGIVPGDVQLLPIPHGSLHGGLGFYFREGMLFAAQRPRLRVHAGERVDLDINLEVEFGSIRGSVVDRHGVPLEGVSIQVESLSSPLTDALPLKLTPFAETKTDEQGAFEFAAPIRLAPYRVTLMQGGPIESRDVLRTPAQGIRFEARPTVRVILRMRTPAGPVDHPGPTVHALRDGEDSFREVDPSVFRNRAPFEFELPAGTYDFVMTWANALPTHMEGVVLESTAEFHELEALFEPGFRLRASLSDPERPIPEDVWVLLLEEDKWSQVNDPFQVGGRGSPYPALVPSHIRSLFLNETRIEGGTRPLPPGRYRFKVFPPDITIEPEWIEMGSSDQRVEIRWE